MRRLLTIFFLLVLASPASALEAGAGRADITPPTGYFAMGWVRSDAKLAGVHTRLFARAIVLKQGDRKVALVAADLGAIPGGLVKHAAELNASRGFSEQNVIVSASHTHAAPTGFYNFGTYNTVFMTTGTPTDFKIADTATDRQLYAFMVKRIAEAIRRADEDLAPAEAGWGSERILNLTRNRSLEAHLANHGVIKEFGEGSVTDDPLGYEETIDADVEVLRVDKVRRGRRIPIGIWSTFANHGTVVPHTFTFYNADHHGAATRIFEQRVRRAGKVPRRQLVVNAYGNTDEGDQSAGLDRRGPAAAEFVGRVEAAAMMRAWRRAGRAMSGGVPLDVRWNRVCFCGQETEGGAVDSRAVVGLPLFTGSEEGRGPLFDVTKEEFEGRRSPTDGGPQGHKIQVNDSSGGVPQAVPLTAVRVGSRMIVTVPGEMTAGMGRRVRDAVVEAVRGSGVERAVISGVANEFLQYFTTPEEYERQHYEGGSVLYGKLASNVLKLELSTLAARLVRGEAAPAPYDFDPTNGVTPDGEPFGEGAERGEVVDQPAAVRRLQRAEFGWKGGERGLDRPLDRAFLHVQRRVGRRWRTLTSDMGMQITWQVDDEGEYLARWEVPLDAPRGRYRFVVTAKRYRLESRSFRVSPTNALTPRVIRSGGGRTSIALDYPADPASDFTYRRRSASGGRVVFGERVVRRRRGEAFTLRGPAGAKVTVRSARDRFGNSARVPFEVTL